MRRIALFVGVVAFTACGHPSAQVEEPAGNVRASVVEVPHVPPESPPPNPPLTQEELLSRFAGRYRISRTLEHDGCGGRIVGTAQTLVVDASARVLHADRVDRQYPARVENERLIAERRFEETACPESNHYARWIFERTPRGNLEGTVESQWLLPPCQSPCVVRFRIVATPLP